MCVIRIAYTHRVLRCLSSCISFQLVYLSFIRLHFFADKKTYLNTIKKLVWTF